MNDELPTIKKINEAHNDDVFFGRRPHSINWGQDVYHLYQIYQSAQILISGQTTVVIGCKKGQNSTLIRPGRSLNNHFFFFKAKHP